jgi:hypothetical protein
MLESTNFFLQNGIYPLRSKSLFGECKITLPSAKCEKALFLCVDCPKPGDASYSADEDTENNKKCVYIKPKIFCDDGKNVIRLEN